MEDTEWRIQDMMERKGPTLLSVDVAVIRFVLRCCLLQVMPIDVLNSSINIKYIKASLVVRKVAFFDHLWI